MKYDTVFPAFADRVVSRLAAIGAVGAAAAFLKWEWTVAAGFAAGVVFHILFFLYMKQRYIHWEKEERDAAYIGQMGAALAGSRLFVEAGLATRRRPCWGWRWRWFCGHRFPFSVSWRAYCHCSLLLSGQGNSVE